MDTVRKLSQFLGLPASDDLCAAIADACDFGKLRDYNAKEKVDPLQFAWKDDHHGIYRKGNGLSHTPFVQRVGRGFAAT